MFVPFLPKSIKVRVNIQRHVYSLHRLGAAQPYLIFYFAMIDNNVRRNERVV